LTDGIRIEKFRQGHEYQDDEEDSEKEENPKHMQSAKTRGILCRFYIAIRCFADADPRNARTQSHDKGEGVNEITHKDSTGSGRVDRFGALQITTGPQRLRKDNTFANATRC
jgi:hypothetical protein